MGRDGDLDDIRYVIRFVAFCPKIIKVDDDAGVVCAWGQQTIDRIFRTTTCVCLPRTESPGRARYNELNITGIDGRINRQIQGRISCLNNLISLIFDGPTTGYRISCKPINRFDG